MTVYPRSYLTVLPELMVEIKAGKDRVRELEEKNSDLLKSGRAGVLNR